MPQYLKEDGVFMKAALRMALQAQNLGEVPVGAVVVQKIPQGTKQGGGGEKNPPLFQVVARACNQKESLKKATAHAEILALEQASEKLARWRLSDCTLYVTLEPCTLCASALVAARVQRLVYGAGDLKAGAVHSLYQITQDKRLNHQVEVSGGLMAEESSRLLKNFFRTKRGEPPGV